MVYFDGGSFDVSHGFESFIGTLSAVLLAAIAWYTFQYQKKKDAQDRQDREKEKKEKDKREANEHAEKQRNELLEAIQAVEVKTEQRHAENKSNFAVEMSKFSGKMGEVTAALRYIKLHRHREDKPGEVLTKDGIEYGPEQW